MVKIQDTSGDEHLVPHRRVQYQDADCFMICVACNDPDSFESIDRFKAEIKHLKQDKPIFLILTKFDMLE